MNDEARYLEMLQSFDPAWTKDHPRIKILLLQARMGSIMPPNREEQLTAICECGWRGTFLDCTPEAYDNGQWARRAGRKGTHWICPRCGETVWKYYDVIN